MVYLLLFLVASLFSLYSPMIYKLPMPDGLQEQFDGAKIIHNISEITGEQIFWECMQRVKWQMAEDMGNNVTRETRDYLDRLLQLAVDSAHSQPPRHRMEYRMMSEEARVRFHKAIRALREDKTLEPNVYTAIAELHAGEVIPMAHFGAGFLGWHRVFLIIFETALRMKDPTVSVPYWASNLDHEMADPTKSIIWSERFFGNGDGFVRTGPFGDFKVISADTILSRNIGSSGSLMTNEGIHGVLSQNSTEAIVSPSSPQSQNIELQHNMVHVWVGGDMDDLSTSAEDPVFYMHHSFIDYLWEEFRTKQKLIGVDPETDYPKKDWGPLEHAPTSELGFGDLRNIDALTNVLADMVKYDPSPVCSRTHPSCGSRYLRCDTYKNPPICVSLSREEVDHKLDKDAEICVEAQLTRAIQNNFAINKYCDIRKWSYIPIKVILQRPPEFTNYKSFPVYDNKPMTDRDVFATVSPKTNVTRVLAKHPNCRKTGAVARRIYIESHGLNYYGKYKDFTILDQRHALSTTTTYLGVKTPELNNHTDVILFAYDYCGRMCRPFCLDVLIDPPKPRPCSGVFRVTPEEPKLYGESYAEIVNNVWRADHPDDLPEVNDFNALITFYCDYSGAWPWDKNIQTKDKLSRLNFKRRKQPIRPYTKLKRRKNPIKSHNNRRTVENLDLKTISSTQIPPFIARTHPMFEDVRLLQTKAPRPIAVNLQAEKQLIEEQLQQPFQQKQTSHQKQLQSRASPQQKQSRRPVGRRQRMRQRRRRPSNPIDRRRMRQHDVALTSSQEVIQSGRQRLSDLGLQYPANNCRLNGGCILSMPCSPCQYQVRQRCQTPSRLVAICINGVYMIEPMFFSFTG